MRSQKFMGDLCVKKNHQGHITTCIYLDPAHKGRGSWGSYITHNSSAWVSLVCILSVWYTIIFDNENSFMIGCCWQCMAKYESCWLNFWDGWVIYSLWECRPEWWVYILWLNGIRGSLCRFAQATNLINESFKSTICGMHTLIVINSAGDILKHYISILMVLLPFNHAFRCHAKLTRLKVYWEIILSIF